ncbi:MAG: hypothetical protein KGY45_02965 [Hadesarchaea archaeon]|nr:hypothetical protein [Hadesarchaea archaeon]
MITRKILDENIIAITSGKTKLSEIEDTIKKIKEISESHNVTSQVFDAECIAGKKHIIHSTRLALKAIESGNNFAESPDIELACWISGTRQINKALKNVGIREDTEKITLITIGISENEVKAANREISNELEVSEDESVLEITPEKVETLKKLFSLKEKEIKVASLEDLILERIALLSLE